MSDTLAISDRTFRAMMARPTRGQDTMTMTTDTAERKAWADAYGIAYVGASNTAGVARTIGETVSALRRAGMSSRDVDRHVTVRAMVAHLAYLTGQGLGPTDEDFRAIGEHARTDDN